MSRLITYTEFYLSESLATYLQALRQALLKRGLSRKFYLDNGPTFRSHHLEEITASLDTALRAPGQEQDRKILPPWKTTSETALRWTVSRLHPS